ncbi:hypothetical protein BDE36_2659 [Arcticibacter tournemirensis]|uniref:DUF922 domain-containing protein n=1 Tax=Arcticibacter tournemirensis TaxID=699437 RepID=A0A5M9H908_9SPHI|nr:hypothetical protein [Arcticibacter tournemirensis]KAA8483413.1 hypothetical protein F1649_09505 [Arcticibacter tournemirensis]TQM50893.1 hypothetical protein BDE36_2659 [Arcticibacter tournemirensis]
MKLRRTYKTYKIQLLFIVTGLILINSFQTSAQIVLENSPIVLKPTGYYIATIADERTSKGAVASLVIKNAADQTIVKTTDLHGGAIAAVNNYLSKNLQKDRSLRAVTIGLNELKVSEATLPDGSIEGRIKLHLSFGLTKEYGVAPLTSPKFALRYTRPVGNTTSVESHIRNILRTALVSFDNWMKANVKSDWRLARDVRFNFSDYREQPEGDTIYYSPERKLTWGDFQSQNIHSNKYQALVIPGLGYIQDAKLKNETIYVDVAMKAYLPKSACWASSAGRNQYALNHEQRHFDIVKIIAEQFKQKVLTEKLTPDTYEAFLNMQYLDSLRDMHAMQKAYDIETSHGMNAAAQAKWNDRIDSDLKKRDNHTATSAL